MWSRLQRSGNQKLLSLIGAGVATVPVAAWTVFTYFDQGSAGKAAPSVQAEHGVAAGGNIERSTIRIDGGSDGGAKGK
jgi:hypothetical protein